ncbi:glyoxalase [Brachybacterium sp. AOP43-C2-M15]|uniref:glyoxalase n=1 Tax=Brachybacterium sp. AOP43-C2-M15 TaxID=3457661 RepID=UPI004034A86C
MASPREHRDVSRRPDGGPSPSAAHPGSQDLLATLPQTEAMVPILPCADADRAIDFYRELGFSVLHRQSTPYLYIALAWRGISLHLDRVPEGVDRAREDFACLITVDDITPYHRHFAARLKERMGRVPATGRPRLTRLRPGASRFTLVDPDGNGLIVVRRDEPAALEYGGSHTLTGLAKALDNARILRDYRLDARAAFRALSSALRRPKSGDRREDRAVALSWMIELASEAQSSDRIPALVEELRREQLTGSELEQALATLSDPEAVRRLIDEEP